MRIIFIISFTIINLFLLSAQSKSGKITDEYYKVSKVRVYVSDISEILELRKTGLSFGRVKYKNGYFDAYQDINSYLTDFIVFISYLTGF